MDFKFINLLIKDENDLIRVNNILFYRSLCAIAAILYPLLGFIYGMAAVHSFQEYMHQRFIFTFLFLFLLFLSFVSNYIRKNIEAFFYLVMFGVAFHTIYLISLNNYVLSYSYSILFIIIVSNISFKNDRVLVIYNVIVLALVSLTLYQTPAPEMSKLLYLIIIFLLGLLSYISAHSILAIERKLMIESNKQQMLLDNIEAQVWYLEDEETLGSVNQAYANFVGLEKDKIENQSINEVRGDQEANTCVNSNEQVFNTKEKAQTEGWVENSEGEKRLLFVTKVPKLDEEGAVEYVICTAYDITEQRSAEEKLANYALELEQTTLKLNQQIEQARKVHEQFLPASFPVIEGLSFAAHYYPAEQLGGDFYGIIKVDQKLIFYLVDITGHGLDGAMLNIFVRESINSFLLNNDKRSEFITPARIIEFIFARYCEESFPDDYFICLQLGVLDLESWELIFANAGSQLLPLLVENSGELRSLNCEGLPISGVVEGELYARQNLEQKTFFFSAGSTLLMSTDGLIEETINGEMYGEQRLLEIVEKNHCLAPDLIVEALNDDFQNFAGSLQGKDDITVMVIQRELEIIDQLDLEIKNNCDAIYEAKKRVLNFIKPYYADIDTLAVGLLEMLSNALEHGNDLDQDKKIIIEVFISPAQLKIVIEDQGPGFDWDSELDKQLEIGFDLEQRFIEDRGRGIILTHTCYDQIYYNQEGNIVNLIKEREKPGE